MKHRILWKARKHVARKGEVYGWWTVIGEEYYIPRTGHLVRCLCRCGVKRDVIVRHLTTGKSTSCGCAAVIRSDRNLQEITDIWREVVCSSPHHGWDNVEVFKWWAARNGYKYGAILRRRSLFKPYTPDNCFWEPKRKPRGSRHCEP